MNAPRSWVMIRGCQHWWPDDKNWHDILLPQICECYPSTSNSLPFIFDSSHCCVKYIKSHFCYYFNLDVDLLCVSTLDTTEYDVLEVLVIQCKSNQLLWTRNYIGSVTVWGEICLAFLQESNNRECFDEIVNIALQDR